MKVVLTVLFLAAAVCCLDVPNAPGNVPDAPGNVLFCNVCVDIVQDIDDVSSLNTNSAFKEFLNEVK